MIHVTANATIPGAATIPVDCINVARNPEHQKASHTCYCPDLPQVKIRIQSEPNNGNGTPARGSDGTESTRSSFVMLNPGDTCEPESHDTSSISISGSTITLDDVDGDRFGRSGKQQRGFVNKCVTKVKSFMGKSQERI